MIRALLELAITIIAIIVARAILTSLLGGIVKAGRVSSPGHEKQNEDKAAQQAQPTGELHKDPVCGTYVAESTPFRREASGQTFYYCSGDCKQKHALVAK